MTEPLDIDALRARANCYLWATGILGPEPTPNELAEMVVRLCDEVEQLRAFAECSDCGHKQYGYPEGYCETLLPNISMCGCRGRMHSDIAAWEIRRGQSEAPTVSDGGKG